MVSVILESDMTFDVDDVGALAVLHALADNGEAEILGVGYNEVHVDGVRAIHAINSWYGHSELPIGQFMGELKAPDRSRYLRFVANMAPPPASSQVKPATRFYVDLLRASRDDSISIISVGFLNNLAELLRDHSDLISAKVSTLVVMAGLVNDSFNFVRHDLVASSQYVIEHWPTPMIVTDYGGGLHTGESLANAHADNPVRESYFRWFDGKYGGRSSWDQIGVLVGVRGEAGGFEFIDSGKGRLRNGFEWEIDGKWRTYAKPSRSNEYYLVEIEKLMTQKPAQN